MSCRDDVLSAFSSGDAPDLLWEKLHAVGQTHFGFSAICYGFTHSKEIFASPGFASRLHVKSSFAEHYIEQAGGFDFIEHDANTHALLRGKPHSVWQQTWATEELTPGQAHQRNIAADFGMNVGVSVLLPDFSGRGVAGICFAAEGISAAEFEALWAERSHDVKLLASAFDACARRPMIADEMHLTPRERDVLAYAAAGLGGKAIADKLGLQPKTVFNTMERARKGLHAASTIEATAKAFVFGLI